MKEIILPPEIFFPVSLLALVVSAVLFAYSCDFNFMSVWLRALMANAYPVCQLTETFVSERRSIIGHHTSEIRWCWPFSGHIETGF